MLYFWGMVLLRNWPLAIPLLKACQNNASEELRIRRTEDIRWWVSRSMQWCRAIRELIGNWLSILIGVEIPYGKLRSYLNSMPCESFKKISQNRLKVIQRRLPNKSGIKRVMDDFWIYCQLLPRLTWRPFSGVPLDGGRVLPVSDSPQTYINVYYTEITRI